MGREGTRGVLACGEVRLVMGAGVGLKVIIPCSRLEWNGRSYQPLRCEATLDLKRTPHFDSG